MKKIIKQVSRAPVGQNKQTNTHIIKKKKKKKAGIHCPDGPENGGLVYQQVSRPRWAKRKKRKKAGIRSPDGQINLKQVSTAPMGKIYKMEKKIKPQVSNKFHSK